MVLPAKGISKASSSRAPCQAGIRGSGICGRGRKYRFDRRSVDQTRLEVSVHFRAPFYPNSTPKANLGMLDKASGNLELGFGTKQDFDIYLAADFYQ